ncbi:MAG: hypothetical protein EAZ86_15215 [Oscillatoriales cyanobacterium]|nr:MAG: hypothetical protein EAZ86_15215 [Oscillatoriales cyanobacterium]
MSLSKKISYLYFNTYRFTETKQKILFDRPIKPNHALNPTQNPSKTDAALAKPARWRSRPERARAYASFLAMT